MSFIDDTLKTSYLVKVPYFAGRRRASHVHVPCLGSVPLPSIQGLFFGFPVTLPLKACGILAFRETPLASAYL